jgi:hypothetical protein
MPRRILLAVLVASGALALAIPAVARTSSAQRSSSLSLRMGGHIVAVIRGGQSAVTATGSGSWSGFGPSTVTYQGFHCQVTVGQGATDTTYQNHIVFDSTEFYVPYRVHHKTRYSVTTNCIGALPTGTVVAPNIISAKTAHCGQINPFNQHKFISGVGITTTFPDGTFSETCNTPNFH